MAKPPGMDWRLPQIRKFATPLLQPGKTNCYGLTASGGSCAREEESITMTDWTWISTQCKTSGNHGFTRKIIKIMGQPVACIFFPSTISHINRTRLLNWRPPHRTSAAMPQNSLSQDFSNKTNFGGQQLHQVYQYWYVIYIHIYIYICIYTHIYI